MTRCLIRHDFFHENSFKVNLRNQADIEAQRSSEVGHENRTLIEFCLPFAELKHIVEGMVDVENQIELAYPVGDNMLEIRIPEESKGVYDKIKVETSIQLDTYSVTHSLDADYSFKDIPVAAQIYGHVKHFKKALREFNFLEPNDIVSIETNETYPKLQIVYRSSSQRRFHAVTFREDVENFIIKKISESKMFFKIESLRLAFGRISEDQILCVVTLNVNGALSVKLMNQTKGFLAESIINCQEDESENEQ